MIEKTCKCGKTKQNFQIDIGPFFIGDCCLEAGYDHLGNNVKAQLEEPKVECPVVEQVTEDSKKKRTRNKSGNLKKPENEQP